jgi:hypothetical protein
MNNNLNNMDLIAKGVRCVVKDKRTFFSIVDVKKLYPEHRVSESDTYMLDYNGEMIATTLIEDFVEYSDFDRKIKESMKFKPKE